ncbi:hypothetical protein [Halobacteriovorax sp. HLS]|uniref:hypothetical protein n=1 Tax=Halobacteriovorax sp. HLS TaxID=2234000 RepID=UPI000FD86C15|nr:hypothetical protein [Halobacteriovorax sp. HLS]
MKLLKRLFGIPEKEDLKGISLLKGENWRVTGVEDSVKLFRSIYDLVPEGSVLLLEGGAAPEHLESFFEEYKSTKITKVAPGTIWPYSDGVHLSVTNDMCMKLSELAMNLAEPEIGIHIHVYKDDTVLLEWHDAFDEDLYISRFVEESDVKKFCDFNLATYKLFSYP